MSTLVAMRLASPVVHVCGPCGHTYACVFIYVFTIFSYSLQDGLSPLYAASHEDHIEVVNILLKNGADPNLATKVCTPMPLYGIKKDSTSSRGVASQKQSCCFFLGYTLCVPHATTHLCVCVLASSL